MSHIKTVNSYLNYVGNMCRSHMDRPTQRTSVSIVRSLSSFNFRIRFSRALVTQCDTTQINVITLPGYLCTYVACKYTHLIHICVTPDRQAIQYYRTVDVSELGCLVEHWELEDVFEGQRKSNQEEELRSVRVR